MSYLSSAYGFLRLGLGLRAFLREPISIEAAKARIRAGLARRDEAFLELVEQAVFASPNSPYLRLFKAAHCEPGDVRATLKQEGLEGTLRTLLEAGIYVTYEEFKGRAPAVRGSQSFAFRDTDFDNPLITTHYRSSSSGTRGTPTRIRIDLEHIAQSAPHWGVWFAEHDWLASPLVLWTPFYAGVANRQLMCAKFGVKMARWFTPADVVAPRDRLPTAALHRVIRLVAGFPPPEFIPTDEQWRVGEYLIDLARRGMRPLLNCSSAAAVRLCLAMQERGESLKGVSFLLVAEPLTPARRATIEATGATAVPAYGFSEGGNLGSQCRHPAAADDVHIFEDAFAVIQRERRVGDSERVEALLMTGLRSACSKVMLNTETGDHAVPERRACGCLFGELGYTRRLHTIRSFEKLTGEGVTFVGADLFRLLEEVLPRRFGGAVGDYQLVEEQDARGAPRYSLLVSPELGPLDHRAIAATLLEELAKRSGPYRLMAGMWRQADSLEVKRRRPVATARGKVLPFRPLGPASPT